MIVPSVRVLAALTADGIVQATVEHDLTASLDRTIRSIRSIRGAFVGPLVTRLRVAGGCPKSGGGRRGRALNQKPARRV